MPLRASVDDSALAQFGLKRHKLLICASAHRSIDNSNLMRLQLAMNKFDQIRAANGVESHRPMVDRPPVSLHAIAMAADVNANHARTKRLLQHLGVGRVVAEICDNESIGIIAAINRRERAGTCTSIKPLRELLELLNSD